MNYDTHTGNMNQKVFDSNLQVKQVSVKNVNTLLQEELGWKILRHPTSSEAGVIYRDAGDITFQSGLGTSLQLQPDIGVEISSKYSSKKNNATQNYNRNTKTIVFTNEELDTMGMVRDPIPALVKGYSHRMMLQETQAIRETLVNEFTYDYKKDGKDKLKQKIKDGTHDWYINLPEGVTLDQLDKDIRKRYKASTASSDVDGFNDKVTLVRKDMSDFVEGYKEIQLGAAGTKLNKAFSILKKAILMQKIHWIITAPVKITMDAISNTAYLMSRNVPITTIYKKSKTIANEMVEFTKIREDLLKAEFDNRVNPTDSGKKKIEKLENKIKNHRLASAHFRGFIQSIAIDLTQKNEHTAQGIHKDVGNFLDKLFKNDDESLNKAGKAISAISKFGPQGEDLLVYIADKVKNNGTSNVAQGVAKTLEGIAEHIKDLKSKDDVSAYLQEYMATPGTSLVNVGSIAVQTPDVILKVTLQEHLVEIAVNEFKAKNNRAPNKEELLKINEKASLEAVISAVDYKVNIPRELRFLEQTGVTSFISFWARIQKVMLVSLRTNPVNAMATIVLSELLNIDGATIFDANIADRWGSGSIVGAPNPGMDMILPTKIFG